MRGSADRNYRVIGVMSGSSLDGIDLALCDLWIENERWKFRIEEARTVTYDEDLRSRLIAVMDGSALELARLHVELGRTIGNACKEFLSGEKIDLIASHGHTIFHKPDEGLTTQIGCGAQIAAVSGITTICDFRTSDVALGGQGAPLVPIGEQLLFPEFGAFINLGGIANISIHRKNDVIGYDIGPCNMALNVLAAEAGKNFDENGSIARTGTVDDRLLRSLNELTFYQKNPPRSLGREWFDEAVKPLAANAELDALRARIYDDVTGLSLSVDASPVAPRPAGEIQAVFFGLGSDGTVGANKSSVKIIGESPDLLAQGYFVYDSKKSGATTVSHLRFGPEPIRSTYLIDGADFVACHQFGLLEKVAVLDRARPGATFLLNSPFPADQVWDHLPIEVQRELLGSELGEEQATQVAGLFGGAHANRVAQAHLIAAVANQLPCQM